MIYSDYMEHYQKEKKTKVILKEIWRAFANWIGKRKNQLIFPTNGLILLKVTAGTMVSTKTLACHIGFDGVSAKT